MQSRPKYPLLVKNLALYNETTNGDMGRPVLP